MKRRDRLVYQSVAKANAQNRNNPPKSIDVDCKRCGEDLWHAHHGIDSKYKSKYNPGEYVEWTCDNCGYSWEKQC